MEIVTNEYSTGMTVPSRDLVFNAFQATPWKDLRVVILGREPLRNGTANGLAYGMINDDINDIKPVSYPLRKIEECVDHIEKDEWKKSPLFFAYYDLAHWADQGVLLLNTALTARRENHSAHLKLWAPWTKKVLQAITENSSGVIFCAWGKHAQSYITDRMREFHHVLEFHEPMQSAFADEFWDCPHFEEINEILTRNNNQVIKW